MPIRTKLLLAAAGLVGILWGGDQGYRKYIEEPTSNREALIGKLEVRIADRKRALKNSARLQQWIDRLGDRSLPRNSELARARYRDWLLRMVEQAELQKPSVDSGNPIAESAKNLTTNREEEVLKRYPFSVRGRGTLAQVTRFLHTFYRAPHLQKITTISLTPISGGSEVDMTLSIESLGLASCARDESLAEGTTSRLASEDLAIYQPIVRRDIFASDLASPLSRVHLTAITVDRDGLAQAWFRTAPEDPSVTLKRGDTLRVDAHEVEIVDILPERVIVLVDGSLAVVGLGDSLGEREKDRLAPIAAQAAG